jgi:hypothetical protein
MAYWAPLKSEAYHLDLIVPKNIPKKATNAERKGEERRITAYRGAKLTEMAASGRRYTGRSSATRVRVVKVAKSEKR